MHLLSALLLGISTNLDNLLIGISFGFLKKRITIKANLVIGLFSAAATCFFCYFSSIFSRFGRIPNIIGGIIIILMGAFSLMLSKEYDGKQYRDITFSWKDTIVLGSGLAINCIPVAIGAGLTGLTPLSASLTVGALSVLSVAVGNHIGFTASASKLLRPRMFCVIGGIIMIALGILELFI